MEINDELYDANSLCDAVSEANEFVNISEARTKENKVVPSRGALSSRVFDGGKFFFTPDVSQGNIVLPFKLGPYVPLEALSANWQRDWNRGETPVNIYNALVTKLTRAFGRKKRDETRRRYQELYPELITGLNMDAEFQAIIPFSNATSAAEGMTQIVTNYGREVMSTINPILALVEKKILEFVSQYGVIAIQKLPDAFRAMEVLNDGVSRMSRRNPSPKQYYPFNGWRINGIGSIYDEKGLLQGCFFLPYDVYMYQYASINTGGSRQAYYGSLDIYKKQNCFYVMSEKARQAEDPINAINQIAATYMSGNRGFSLYYVEDLLEFITGEPFNDKVLTFSDL